MKYILGREIPRPPDYNREWVVEVVGVHSQYWHTISIGIPYGTDAEKFAAAAVAGWNEHDPRFCSG